MSFKTWLATFCEEKGIDMEQRLTVAGPSGDNSIPVGCVIEAINQAPASEQAAIKTVIVKIDFLNGDVIPYFRHLAQAIAI